LDCTSCSGSFLDNYDVIFNATPLANWNDNFLTLYLNQYRDTTRVENFLTDYFNDNRMDNVISNFRYRELANRLDTLIVSDEKLDESLLFFINNILSGLYHDGQSQYDGYGFLRTISMSQTFLHKVPYVLKHMSSGNVNDIFNREKLGHYPDISFNNSAYRRCYSQIIVKDEDPVTTDINLSLLRNPGYWDNTANAYIDLQEVVDFVNYSDIISDLELDYAYDLSLNQVSGSPQNSFLVSDSYNFTHTNGINEFISIYMNGGANNLGRVQASAPYNDHGFSEIMRLYNLTASSSCGSIDGSVGDTNCRDYAYNVAGFNLYYFNTIDETHSIDMFLTKNNVQNTTHTSFPVYYRLLIPDNISDDASYNNEINTYMKDLNQTTFNSANSTILQGSLSNFGEDEIFLTQNLVNPEYPIALLLSTSISETVELRTEVDGNTCRPNDLYMSTHWEDLKSFIDDVRLNWTCP